MNRKFIFILFFIIILYYFNSYLVLYLVLFIDSLLFFIDFSEVMAEGTSFDMPYLTKEDMDDSNEDELNDNGSDDRDSDEESKPN